MLPNHSPWIKQLNRTRPVVPLAENISTDIAIVGGGIAGVTTAFFILRDTNKRVVLVEADKIAHGATGHNAGQITSYFERPLFSLVEEFGLEQAIEGQKSIESVWILIDEMVTEAKLETPLYRFTGYAGLSNFDQVLIHLKNNHFRLKGGLQVEEFLIAKEWDELKNIPEEYKDLYTLAPHEDILGLLETNNKSYIASISYQKGCMNSALFSEELIGYLITKYKDCFAFYEGSPVKSIELDHNKASLKVLTHQVDAQKIILCTNGFENFDIENKAGAEINTTFHHSVAGRIGYMSGYIEPINHPPTAISYFPQTKNGRNDPTGESYFYLTRRPHEHEGETSYNLICTGGPEKVLPNGASYSRQDACSEEMRAVIDEFLRHNYNKHPKEKTEYSFCWHGLMGYTPNGIRRVGPEPINPVLIYNLGCNGVGILPSIFGAKRISQIINGEKIEPSIFDPQNAQNTR